MNLCAQASDNPDKAGLPATLSSSEASQSSAGVSCMIRY